MSRLAVFDLDGTLVDSLADLHASVNHALESVGLPSRSLIEVRGFVGEGARRLLEKAVAPRNDLLDPALTAWREHYEAHLLDRTRAYPGIPEVLEGARCALAVLTNKPAPMARAILDGLGLSRWFAAVLGGGEAPRKPDPGGLRDIMFRLAKVPGETVLVGDSCVDVQTGHAAGIAVVAVAWGLGDEGSLSEADAIVRRPAELKGYLGS